MTMKIKHATVKTSEGERHFKIEVWDKKMVVHRLRGASYEKIGSAETLDDALALIKSSVGGSVRGIDLKDG